MKVNTKLLFFSLATILIVAISVPLTFYFVNKSKTPTGGGGFQWEIPENATKVNDNTFRITYMVPMRDGVRLATDVYVPSDINQSLPVLLIRTPYNKNDLSIFAIYVNYYKIAIVIQDMRGFYASEGELYLPFFTEHQDGHDTLNWIAKQEWCNGKIVTWGPSALGITQYLTAPNAPDVLKAQMPIVATPDVYFASFKGGELRKELVTPWMEHQGFSEEAFNTLIQHEKKDSFWNIGSIEQNYSQIHVPALHMGGWYDIFTKETIDAFMGYQYHGGEGAKGNSKLVMGPWIHGGMFGEPTGEINFPNQDFGILLTVSEALFRAWLMDNFTLWNQLPTVAFYLMSSLEYNPDLMGNRWYQSDHWPIEFESYRLFFHKNGTLLSSAPTDDSGAISYIYDPTNPVPTIGGGNLNIDAGIYDQQSVEVRDDVIIFTTPVLEEPLTIVGSINVTLYVSSNCTDTDFTVKLTDVYPDNKSMLITDTILRARNRNSYSDWDFMEPGQIYELNIQLDPTAYVFNKGHRIRIAISSSNYPRFEVNPNTGDPLYQNNTYYIANNTVFANSLYSSSVVFPKVNYSELVPYQFPTLGLQLQFQALQKPSKSIINFGLWEKVDSIKELFKISMVQGIRKS